MGPTCAEARQYNPQQCPSRPAPLLAPIASSPARRRRHGRGVSRPRPAAGPRRRAQDPAAPTLAGDPGRLERFEREARAVAALNHPHIVTIYSTEEADGIRFLTMELVEGQTLDALIPPGGLPLPRFLELALPLADALTAAHQKQITHRDLKPANVMVTRDGRVKVLDFGLRARRPSRGRSERHRRHAGVADAGRHHRRHDAVHVAGTDRRRSRSIHRRDLFSLGVMFHEMLDRRAAVHRRVVAAADVVDPAGRRRASVRVQRRKCRRRWRA